MAKCSYCGRKVSWNAKACPGCGEPDPATSDYESSSGSGSSPLVKVLFFSCWTGTIVSAIVMWIGHVVFKGPKETIFVVTWLLFFAMMCLIAWGGLVDTTCLPTQRQCLNPHVMPRDITPANRARLHAIEALGYRTGIGENAGRWIATAKNDATGQFHVAKAETEDEVIAALVEMATAEAH
jgi:hypothetical protein